jgi:hypothetical protein
MRLLLENCISRTDSTDLEEHRIEEAIARRLSSSELFVLGCRYGLDWLEDRDRQNRNVKFAFALASSLDSCLILDELRSLDVGW